MNIQNSIYENAKIEIITLDSDDIITTSGFDGEDDTEW